MSRPPVTNAASRCSAGAIRRDSRGAVVEVLRMVDPYWDVRIARKISLES